MKKRFFDKLSPEFKRDFDKWAKEAQSIVISSHISPDDDSISSVLSVYYYLTKCLKISKNKVHIYYTGEKTTKWGYFENYNDIQFVDDIYNHITKKDLLVFVDGSGWGRFSRIGKIRGFEGRTICIDHHHTPEDRFDLHIVAKEYTSCVEIIYRLFLENEKLGRRICETIFLGISGDTGNFKYLMPENSEVFLVAERLLREGRFAVEDLQSKYQNISRPVYMALGKIMSSSEVVEVDGWPKLIIAWLDTKYVSEEQLSDNMVSEASSYFTGYLKSVEGVTWGVVSTPRRDSTSSLSLRSLPGSVSVRVMMEQTGFGGGHDRAAGGKIRTKEPKDAIDTLIAWMKKNKPTMV